MSTLLIYLRELDKKFRQLEGDFKRQREADARKIRRLEAENQQLRDRLAVYEPPPPPASSTDSNATNNYSVDRFERNRAEPKTQQSKWRGRIKTDEKIKAADRNENVCPDGMTPETATFVNERPVWRIIDGRAARVAYRFYKEPFSNEVPKADGVLPNCEFGIEILVILAFLKFVVGVSIDNACEVMNFFLELPLQKSQANELLGRLAREWEQEFETLCDLILKSAVV